MGWDFWATLGGMANRRGPLFLVSLFALVSVAALGQAATQTTTQTVPTAQSAAPVATVMPKDPDALMLMAARVNGLSGADMTPWHLKASYQTFDADGKPKDAGTFEEWWAGPEKYKLSYSSAGFNQVQYRNGKDTFMTGDVKWPPMPEFMVVDNLVRPLPPVDTIKQKYSGNDAKVGGLALKCLHAYLPPGPGGQPILMVLPMYCFGEDLAAVRIKVVNQQLTAYFNSHVRFDDQYVAKQIRVMNIESKHPLVNIDLDVLEPLVGPVEADFVPPPSAKPLPAPPRRIAVAAGVIAGFRIGGDEVRYPPIAREQRIQGVVVLQATIAKDGTIGDLKVISGPEELRQSALDAVKTWRYKPFLSNGEPVDVMTQVNIVYRLGG